MKHKFICRIACCAAAFLATAGVLAFGGSLARAAGDVEINETNFPDKIFRNIILSETYGEDGVLTEEEISDVKWISINNDGISSLQGIEYFTSLETLICEGAKLTSLDLSKNT